MTFYDLSALDIDGKEVAMSDYEGKVLLVVNTASECGFTPQFEDLEALYQQYKDQGLVILGFPSNQFGGQDPGSNEDIKSFCQLNYGVSFPMFSKIKVNGKEEHPIYTFLKNEKGGLFGDSIKWNFTKFLIDRQGQVVKRYAPKDTPKSLEDDIVDLLNK